MADVATSPSSAAVVDATNTDKKVMQFEKPEKPDEDAYKKNLAATEKAKADIETKLATIKAKIDVAIPSEDSPAAKERTDLLNQLKSIRKQQGDGKAGRGQIMDKIKKIDESMRADLNNLKNSRNKVNFKGLEDVDREIERLDKQVNGGMMKLVDEKKALNEISSLRKQRKQFSGFDDIQKTIDQKKVEIKKLRDTLDDPESKALSDRYSKVQAQYDAVKAEADEAYKNISGLRDERSKLNAQQKEAWNAFRKVKDDHYKAIKAFGKYEYDQRQRFREKRKAEQESYLKGKKMERAQQMLAEAGEPAYLDEIRRAQSLIQFFDPSAKQQEKAPLQAPSGLAASAQRTIDDSGLKGIRVVKKEEEDYFAGTGGKKNKGKKNKKNPDTPATPTASKFSCPPAVMEDCTAMGIDPPMSAADIPSVLEKVKARLDHWKSDQKAQTDKNIAKAQKEIARLEAEEIESSAPPTTATNGHGHGETKATAGVDEGGSVANEVELQKEAAADVTVDLKEASLEDKE
ncbi:hypothetical protein BJ875DRAFT_455442 [Amylocarpus encephaloides]|uniref:Nuclear segregation protein Bfr1 n=1 Tax=Amylocarpus encephaloides TaxID=45428 RepID=A0A9P8C7G6_9HELO|nr:hypothetical protein BJ875DRAFT_455442 [Amylocarpus encephaloides]